MKTCKMCGETKALSEYYRHNTSKDGRRCSQILAQSNDDVSLLMRAIDYVNKYRVIA